MKLSSLFGMLIWIVLLLPGSLVAGNGYQITGQAVRVKTVLLMDIRVYRMTHSMKNIPQPLNPRAVIEAEVDKKVEMVFLRNLSARRVIDATIEAYELNGYRDRRTIRRFLQPLDSDIRENERVVIEYRAADNKTVLTFRGRSSEISGSSFMHATWAGWFGNIDQPDFPGQLLSRMH